MLKISLSWLFPAAICGVAAFQVHGADASVAEAKRDEVKVSAFGFHRSNSTGFIQRALDSGAKRVVLDR